MQQRDAGADGEGVVGIVGREDHREPVGGEPGDLPQHQRLVAEIEAGGGLVHDQDGGLLRQRAGDQHELALAARQPGVVGPGEIPDAEAGERALRRFAVDFAGLGEQAEPRGAAHQHHLQRGVGEGRRMGLRDIGRMGRDLAPGEPVERRAGKQHRPAARRDQPEQGLEQRRLAGPVGAQQAEDLARPGAERDAGPDLVAGIADRQIPGLDGHAHVRRPRPSSQRKNGAPTTAVRMPSGTSTAETVRASVSTASM